MTNEQEWTPPLIDTWAQITEQMLSGPDGTYRVMFDWWWQADERGRWWPEQPHDGRIRSAFGGFVYRQESSNWQPPPEFRIYDKRKPVATRKHSVPWYRRLGKKGKR